METKIQKIKKPTIVSDAPKKDYTSLPFTSPDLKS